MIFWVWLVVEHHEYEGTDILGVFSAPYVAADFVKKCANRRHRKSKRDWREWGEPESYTRTINEVINDFTIIKMQIDKGDFTS